MTGFPDIVEREVLVTQSCPMLYDPMDCSPPGSSGGRGIPQARMLGQVAMPFFKGSLYPGIEPGSLAWQADSLPTQPPGKNIVNQGQNFKLLQSSSFPYLADAL